MDSDDEESDQSRVLGSGESRRDPDVLGWVSGSGEIKCGFTVGTGFVWDGC